MFRKWFWVFLSTLLISLSNVQSAAAAETLLGTISMAVPQDAVFTSDGSVVWIISHSDQKIYKYSTATRTALGSVSLGGSAYSAVFNADESKLYVQIVSGTYGIAVINTSTLTKSVISLTGSTWGITTSPNKEFIYITEGSGVVRKISTSTDTIVASSTLPTTGQVRDVKTSPDGSFIYVCDWNNSKVYKLNSSDLSLVGSLTATGATFVAISSDGTYGFIMPYSGSNIYKFNTSNMSIISTISGFNSAAEAIFSNDGLYLYIENAGNGSISKMKLSDNAVTSTFGSATATAWHAALSPNGNELYQMSTAGTIYVYDLGNPVIVTLSLTLPSSATYRTSTVISVGVSSGAGKVTFQANGKSIPGCIKVQVSSLSASCTFKPSLHGGIVITASYRDSAGTTIQRKTLSVKARSGNR